MAAYISLIIAVVSSKWMILNQRNNSISVISLSYVWQVYRFVLFISWTRLNHSTVVCPFNVCLLMAVLLFADNDNRINRILGTCLCTLEYIRLVSKRYTLVGRASPCIPLSNWPNILKCTKIGTYTHTNILHTFRTWTTQNALV